MKEKVLVTGGTGFIGRHLVKALVKKGYDVTCLVRKSSNIESLKNVKFVYGDILDKESLKEAVKNKDYVFHLVGFGILSAESEKYYKKFYQVNVLGTKNLLDAIIGAEKKPKKIVCYSSTAAAGLHEGEIDEKTPCKPKTPYQRSKYEMEQLVQEYAKKYKLKIAIIRPAMVYGPDGHSELRKIEKLVKLGIVPIVGDGNNAVPLVHVNDLVNATIIASEKGKGIYFIASEKQYTMNEIVDMIAEKMGKSVIKVRIPVWFMLFVALIFEQMSFFGVVPLITRDRVKSIVANRRINVSKAKMELGFSAMNKSPF